MGFATGKKGYLTQKLASGDLTLRIDRDIGVTEGRLKLKDPNNRDTTYVEWLSFSTNTANGDGTYTLGTLVRGLSQTADPATAGTGKTFGAGTECVLVAMHDQLPDKQASSVVFEGNITADDITSQDILAESLGFTSTTKGGLRVNNLTTTQRDALVGVLNGTIIYNTTASEFQIRQGGAWVTMSSGSTQPNASTTVAGKVQLPVIRDLSASTGLGSAGPVTVSAELLASYLTLGDGSDGDVTISSNTSLTRDMYYNNLTVNTGIILDPAGYVIYVRGTLTLTGTAKIARNGNNGTSASSQTGGAGGVALATGSIGPCGAGTNGGNGGSITGSGSAGVANTSVNPSYSTTSTVGAQGGAGGSGSYGSGAGGAIAGISTRGALYNVKYTLGQILSFLSTPSRGSNPLNATAYGGSPSGTGGGGGSGANSVVGPGGGGGGGNGGTIIVYANTLAGTGIIEAKGGNGGNGHTVVSTGSGGGGGGAGGSGGIVILFYYSGTPFTITLTGGTGGTGGTGSVNNGANGATGTIGQSIIVNL